MYAIWMDNPLLTIDGTSIDDTLADILKSMIKLARTFNDFPEQQAVAIYIRKQCEEFKPYVPLIVALRNPGLKQRHYDQISEETGEIYAKQSYERDINPLFRCRVAYAT